jgi:DnaJ-class molecular chaperone
MHHIFQWFLQGKLMGELKEVAIIKRDKKMLLLNGEVLCDVCRGWKQVEISEGFRYIVDCPKCHGTGKLDWIENVVGKKIQPR